ncbi:hypothetical protein MPSEU_000824200 [Mayamaea pseudoterrestris]|nr:hypothetical protein MPSEU_000824200 [Mayamaea pseudoterrestris]
MMKFLSLILIAALSCTASADAVATTGFGSHAISFALATALALEPCPKGSKNCILTRWTPPPRTPKGAVVKTIMEVVQSYPTTGQAGIDGAGYDIVENTLSSKGRARIEYKNLGNFAKLFNGGKPYIDDFVVQLDGAEVSVKSSSRIGQSDLGVNQKRLKYYAKALQAKGWTVPEPKY